MSRLRSRSLFVALFSLLLASALPVGAQTGPDPVDEGVAAGDRIPDRYIVILHPGVDPAQFAADQGIRPDVVYTHATRGFAANLNAAAAQALARNPRVAFVEQDSIMTIAALPTGIDRIDVDENATAGINADGSLADTDVAVLDTGVDTDHSDLNVAGGAGFAGSGFGIFWSCDDGTASFDDGHGHGTHVSGTIAARDDGANSGSTEVVGVVPGARVWGVKVLTDEGSGAISCIIDGVDWVTGRKAEFDDGSSDGDPGVDFSVANMSLGGGNSSSLCNAVNNSVSAGIIYAVAAGNSSQDAANTSPANCSSVITVSAIADFDGEEGALNHQTVVFSSCTEDTDDSFACFSNFGTIVEVAGPGVLILSTLPDGTYGTSSGTSMASPHVAGAAALYKLATGYAGPAHGPSVIGSMTIDGWTVAQDSACGFTQDPDSDPEPLIYTGSSCHAPADPITDLAVAAVSAPATVTTGDVAPVDVTVENTGNQTVTTDFNVTLTETDPDGTTTETVGTEAVTQDLDPGQSVTVSFSWATEGEPTGDHTLTGSHDLVDDDPTNDSASTTVTVAEVSSAMHIGDLDGSSTGSRSTWTASVTITVHDGNEGPVSGATVTGSWSGPVTETDSCTTGSNGQCSVSVTGIRKRDGSVTWTVSGISHTSLSYDSAANHDPDGDSNGTSITVFK